MQTAFNEQHQVRYHKEKKDKMTVRNQLKSLSFQMKMAPLQQYRKTSDPMFENLSTKLYHRGKVHCMARGKENTAVATMKEHGTRTSLVWLRVVNWGRAIHAFQGSHAHNKLPNQHICTKGTAETTSPFTSWAHTSFPAQTSLNEDKHVLSSRHGSNCSKDWRLKEVLTLLCSEQDIRTRSHMSCARLSHTPESKFILTAFNLRVIDLSHHTKSKEQWA